jgi:hypothetical protein
MDMSDTYIIFSPGRTGSHIILEMLTGASFTKGGLADAYGYWLPLNEKEYQQHIKDQNVVIHLHDVNLIKDLDPAAITLIISLRRDVFAQVMSLIVAGVVDEWSGKDYSNKPVDPVTIDPSKFINALIFMLNWQNRVNLSNYKKVVTIYYEDLIGQGAEFLARELNLEYVESRVGQVYQKSPYSYKNIILNWEELYQEYLKIIR